MNNKILLAIAPMLISISSIALGASVTVSNNEGESGVDSDVVVDSLFNQIGTGFVGVGYFDITDAEIKTSNASALGSAFQILGNIGGTQYDIGAGLFLDGVFQLNATGAILPGSAFIGKSIYLVVGNDAAGLGSSTEAFIYKTAGLFTEDPGTPSSFDFSGGPPPGPEGEDPVIIGTIGITYTANWSGSYSGPINESTTAYQTAVLVPEPSTAILSALGALALLRRRR